MQKPPIAIIRRDLPFFAIGKLHQHADLLGLSLYVDVARRHITFYDAVALFFAE